MKVAVVVLLLFIISLCSAQQYLSAAQYTEVFNNWAEVYGKNPTQAEFAQFQQNLDSVIASNEANVAAGHTLDSTAGLQEGLFEYSEMSPEEFLAKQTGYDPSMEPPSFGAEGPIIGGAIGLGVGVIVGIAVGGAAIVAAATVATVVVVKKSRKEKGVELDDKQQDPKIPTNGEKNNHMSITARMQTQIQNESL